MELDNLTYGEMKQIASMFGSSTPTSAKEDHGHNIAVLDRGWVYVGNCRTEGNYLIIEDAKNIRYWGTTNGLGELIDGPKEKTKLDQSGTVKVSMSALQFLIKTEKGWS